MSGRGKVDMCIQGMNKQRNEGCHSLLQGVRNVRMSEKKGKERSDQEKGKEKREDRKKVGRLNSKHIPKNTSCLPSWPKSCCYQPKKKGKRKTRS